MTGRIDHVAAAKDWIENSVKAQASEQPNNEQLAAAYAGIGQVHAALALVEQQRIANRLKVAELDLVEEIGAHDVDGGLNFRIRPYLTAEDWASIEVPEDDEVWR